MKRNSHCYANLHLKPAEFGVWQVGRMLQHKEGVYRCDGRKLAKLFRDTGKNTIYRILPRIVDAGWARVLKKGRSGSSGQQQPTEYYFLSPEEYGEEHPHSHEPDSVFRSESEPKAVPEKGNGPFPKSGTAVPRNGTDFDSEAFDRVSVKERAAELELDVASERAGDPEPRLRTLEAERFAATLERRRGQKQRAGGNTEGKRTELIEMREAAEEARPDWPKGRVYFDAKKWKALVNRFLQEYGREAVLRAVAEMTAGCGRTFEPRGYAGYLLNTNNGDLCRLEKRLRFGLTGDRNAEPEEDDALGDEFRPEPPELTAKGLLRSWESAVSAIDHVTSAKLWSVIEGRPELVAVFDEAVQKLGTLPGCWGDALPFVDAVMADLAGRGLGVPPELEIIRGKLQGRVNEEVPTGSSR